MHLIRNLAVAAVVGITATSLSRRQLVQVAGCSMEPSLWPGDLLVTVTARPSRLRLGQVVIVDDPDQPDHQVVKRIHRLVGDRVDVRGDNPDASTDSRTWGPIDRALVRHIAVCRWPDVRSRLRVTRRW